MIGKPVSQEVVMAWVRRFVNFVTAAIMAGPDARAYPCNDGARFDYALATQRIGWEWKCRLFNRQQDCRHKKGGVHASRHADFNVTTHKFIDGRTRIKCVLCGIEAWDYSGEDFKFARMQKMANNSTNHPSSSQYFSYVVKRGKVVVAEYPIVPLGYEALKRNHPHALHLPDKYVPLTEIRSEAFWVPGPYTNEESEYVQIGEDTNPIKGVQPPTKIDDAPYIIVDTTKKEEKNDPSGV